MALLVVRRSPSLYLMGAKKFARSPAPSTASKKRGFCWLRIL
jgi:hypothetical protein